MDEPPANKARRLNPIKQKQMEERCAFLEEEIRAWRPRLRTPRSSSGCLSRLRNRSASPELGSGLREQLAALTAEWEDLMQQLN